MSKWSNTADATVKWLTLGQLPSWSTHLMPMDRSGSYFIRKHMFPGPCFLNLFHFPFIPNYHVFRHCWNVFFKAHNHLHPIYIILRFWLVFLWLCFSVLTHAYMCVNWVQLVTAVVNYIVCYNWGLGHTVHLCNEPLYLELHYYPTHIHVGLSCVMGT